MCEASAMQGGQPAPYQCSQLLHRLAHVSVVMLVTAQLGQVPVAALHHLQQLSGIVADLGSLHGGVGQRRYWQALNAARCKGTVGLHTFASLNTGPATELASATLPP